MYRSTPLSRIASCRIIYLITAFLFATIVLAAPIDPQDEPDANPEPSVIISASGGPITLEDKYPTLEKCREKCSIEADKSLFYSQVGKHEDKPQKFADENSLKLVREAYPEGFTDKNPDYTGYTKFAERFSQAFAEKTAGTAWALLPTDGTSLDKKVWTKIEKPALTADGGKCSKIIKVDPDDFSKRCVLWERESKEDNDLPNCDKENGPVPKKPSSTGISSGGSRPVDPPSEPSCYPAPTGPYQDAHEGSVKMVVRRFCDKFANGVVQDPTVSIVEEVRQYPFMNVRQGNDIEDDVYDITLKSIPGCQADGGFNLKEPIKGQTCQDILLNAWSKCNNKGRGGSINAGCLTYDIRTKY